MKYVALLRGINVGGNNLIKMARLRECFEKNGFENVVTYIQSGNVIFDSRDKNIPGLEKKIETVLSKTFRYESRVVVRSHPEMKKAAAAVPRDWRTRTDIRRYLLFLKQPLTATQAMKEIQPKEGVDFVKAVGSTVYFATLLSSLTKSGLPKIIGTKVYKDLTIRNFNTMQKLLALMEK